MKIGIVTLYGYFNYGNRLQNFALQEVLKNLDNSVETIVFEKKENILKKYIKRIIEKSSGKYRIKSINDIMRENNIKKFSNKYIKTKYYDLNLLYNNNRVDSEFDKFVVGSDQVWNPMFWKEDINSVDFNKYLLKFASDSKKVSYASSFGISKLPSWWENNISEELKKFSAISVREQAGANIINENLKIDVPVVLDPTMLLTSKQWTDKLELKDNKEDYILCFFLGEKNEETKKYISSISNDNKIIDLMDSLNKKYYCSDPRDFLNYIKNAKAVFTDSFHATVFSIIFKTPFIVFGRNSKRKVNMDSRIETLLKTFKLEDRMYKGNVIDIYSCDFSNSEELILQEQKKSIEYLKNALSKKNNSR